MGGQRPWTSRGPEVMGLTRSTVPSGLRSSMLPRTGKGFPAAAQLIRGVVSKLNSSSETMSKIWGIRSGERGDTHPGGPVRATRLPQSHHSPGPPRVFHLSGGTASIPVTQACKTAKSWQHLQALTPTSTGPRICLLHPLPPRTLPHGDQTLRQPHHQKPGSGLYHFWAL